LHTDATFRDFAAYAGEHQPDAAFCYAVTRQTVEEYADQLRRTLAPATARRKLRLMKGAFARSLPIGARNPFDPLPWTRGDGTGEEVHRRPLTPDELTRLLEVARQDQFMFPLVTTAACTGMRRGDVCRLRWDAVDMAEGMLAVRTDKTGERVEIPIFAPLRVVLETAQANRKPDAVYVWPEAVNLIENTPNLLTRMFKKLAVEAFREASVEPSLPSPPPVARVSLTEVLSAVETAILAGRPEGARRDRIIDNVRRYASGETVRGIEKATGRARGQVSEDLHEAQRLSGLPFMPPPHVAVRAEATIAKVTRQARPSGQRAASIVDWHCLRTSFVTLALSAGVPVETLQLVTGHRTVAVVLANYYRPQRAHLRAALTNVMPEVLTGKKSVQVPSPEKELQELTAKLANGTATEADRVRFRELAAAV
jgi:integrase